jgi:hypothetical protein
VLVDVFTRTGAHPRVRQARCCAHMRGKIRRGCLRVRPTASPTAAPTLAPSPTPTPSPTSTPTLPPTSTYARACMRRSCTLWMWAHRHACTGVHDRQIHNHSIAWPCTRAQIMGPPHTAAPAADICTATVLVHCAGAGRCLCRCRSMSAPGATPFRAATRPMLCAREGQDEKRLFARAGPRPRRPTRRRVRRLRL